MKEELDEDVYYRFIPVQFRDDRILIPKKYINHIHVILLVNHTVFELSFDQVDGKNQNLMEMKHVITDLSQFPNIVVSQTQVIENNMNKIQTLLDDAFIVDIKGVCVQEDTAAITFFESDQDLYHLHLPLLALSNRKNNDIYVIQGEESWQHTLSFHFKSFLAHTESEKARWDMYLLSKGNQKAWRLRFIPQSDEHPDRYFPILPQSFFSESTYNWRSRLYLTKDDTLALEKNNISNLIKNQFKIKPKVERFVMKKNHIDLQISLESPYINELEINHVYLVHRNKDDFTNRKFSVTYIESGGEKSIVNATIDISSNDLFPLYWDIFVGVIANDDVEQLIKVSKVTGKVFQKVDNTVLKY